MNKSITLIVDNRTLILGLDYLYREHMKRFEVESLLGPSTELVGFLGLDVLAVPIEGYYNESKELTTYFLNVRTLQKCDIRKKASVEGKASYQLLAQVGSSEIFGSDLIDGFLPQQRDVLYHALMTLTPAQWSPERITVLASELAAKNSDISLVGIAASIQDPVVLAALRESVALYGAVAAGCVPDPPKITYLWQVDKALQEKVNQFILKFNQLTSSHIKQATADHAAYFYHAFEDNDVLGRCIYLGYDDSEKPIKKYHWAITRNGDEWTVDDFWSHELWTTDKYQKEQLFG